MKYLVSISGGKDSTACLLWALDNLPKEDIEPFFLDTKWEHPSVYEYLDYLESRLDIHIERIETIGMENLLKKTGYFPSVKLRFCTRELKLQPSLKHMYENYYKKGIDFINITGVRREESKARANTECFHVRTDTYNRERFEIKTLNPIAYWNTQRVFDYHKKHGIEVNPLYKKGFSRVGCYPCALIGRQEVRLFAKDKWGMDRMRKLEKEVNAIRKQRGYEDDGTFLYTSRNKVIKDEQTPTLDFGEEFENACVNQYGICE